MKNSTLTELDISDNGLGGSKLDAVLILSTGYDGVVSFADALKVNKSLLYLNLSGNNITNSFPTMQQKLFIFFFFSFNMLNLFKFQY